MNKYKYQFEFKTVLAFCFLCFVFSAESQQLEGLINEALSNNPEIQKFELQYERTSEKVNEVNTIPNTEFGVGYFVSSPETRTGAQRFKVSARQMLPWFGNITARENYVSALADAKFEDIVISKRKLVAAVSKSYYNLFALSAKQEILNQTLELLQTYETMALTAVEVGKSSAVDVLRLQIRQNEVRQTLEILLQKFDAEQTQFNKLLNRDEAIKIDVVNDLTLPAEDFETNRNQLAFHPELLKYDQLFKSVEQSELLNKKEKQPMIGFGLDYINVEKRPDMTFSDNGKDIIMPMLSLSVPIFNAKYSSKTIQNKLEQKEILAEKQAQLNKLETFFSEAINARNSARIRFNTQSDNLKYAQNATAILLRNYETGTINFTDVLEIQALQLKFQIDQIEAVKAYYEQTTTINYLTKEE